MVKYTKVRAVVECPDCGEKMTWYRSYDKTYCSLQGVAKVFWRLLCPKTKSVVSGAMIVFARDPYGGFVNLAPYALDPDGELSVSVAEVLGRAA